MISRLKDAANGRCVAGVWSGYRHVQCSNRNTMGDWCGVHHPDKVKARRDKQEEGWRQDRIALEERARVARLRDEERLRAWMHLCIWCSAAYVEWMCDGMHDSAEVRSDGE